MAEEQKSSKSSRKECYNCWRLIPEDSKFCPFCGFDQIEKAGFKLISEQKEGSVTQGQTYSQTVTTPQYTNTAYSSASHNYTQYGMAGSMSPAYTGNYPRQTVPRRFGWVDIARFIGAFGAFIYLIALVIEIAAVYLYTEYIPLMASFPQPFPFYFVIPPFPTVLINGVYSTGYYVAYPLIAVIATLCFVYMLTVSRNFKREISFSYRGKAGSTLFLIGGLFMAYIFLSYAIVLIAAAFGQSLPAPDFGAIPNYMLIFELIFAPVWEETVYRMMIIGIPILIYAALTHSGDGRKWWKYLLGGNMKITKPVIVMMLISASIFGVAHWAADSGWGLWKIFPAAVAGLILAYLFVRKGLWASILFHFSVDAAGIITSPANNNALLNSTMDGFLFIWIVVGAIFFVYWLMVLYGFVTGIKTLPPSVTSRYAAAATGSSNSENTQSTAGTDEKPPTLSPSYAHFDAGTGTAVAPQTYQHPSGIQSPQAQQEGHNLTQYSGRIPTTPSELAFGYVCSNCGGLEAKYENGKFICVYCGHESDK
ncbi:MAG: CPBP family intramembrane metalloprotease [Thermoplasmata archaeon YP2-bin.285]|uniref:CPBP family intramembrane metalloprotease n=1 Tax=Candidatus Sysuiplasma superficiale TaxID=2823368 RepID=A0A8J8CE37_9ARCH|nr:CPBP family intramembrane metalloprotease [Candidatus Sysuiplasma superficiale]